MTRLQNAPAISGRTRDLSDTGLTLLLPSVRIRGLFINDAYVEPSETFTIALKNPQGIGPGTSTATVTIIDDDTQPATVNPIDAQDFFIRQQYVDFLGRVAETDGFNFWVKQLIGPDAQHKQDYRFMVRGFLQSDEYHFRFALISAH